MNMRFFLLVPALAVGAFLGARIAATSGIDDDVALLSSSDPEEREAGVAALAERGAAAVLAELADTDDDIVRAGLVEAVRRAEPSASNAGALRALLQSNQLADRMAAVLCVHEVPAVLRDELLALAADAKAHVSIRAAAASALGNQGNEARATLLAAARQAKNPAALRRAAVRALARIGGSGADDARETAADASLARNDRIAAIEALADAGRADHLAALLEDDASYVRAFSVVGLAGIEGEDHADLALSLLANDTSPDVRAAALDALEILGADGANGEAVAAALADAAPRVQIRAAQSLARTESVALAEVEDALLALLGSETFQVRHAGALALFAYGSDAGAATMEADASNGSASDRIQAARAHATIAPASEE